MFKHLGEFTLTREELLTKLGTPSAEGNIRNEDMRSDKVEIKAIPFTSRTPPEALGLSRYLAWNCHDEPGRPTGGSCLAIRGDALGLQLWALILACPRHKNLQERIVCFRESNLRHYRIELETITCRSPRSRSSDILHGALLARVGNSRSESISCIGEVAAWQKLDAHLTVGIAHQYKPEDILRFAVCVVNSATDDEAALKAAQISADLIFSAAPEERDDIRIGQAKLHDALPAFFESRNGLVLWMYHEVAALEVVEGSEDGKPWWTAVNQPGFDGLGDGTRRSDYVYELAVHA